MLLKAENGLPAELVDALRAENILTIEALFAADPSTLTGKIPQFREDPSLLQRTLRKLYAKIVPPSRTLAETYKRLVTSHSVLSTGDPALDERLHGGIFTGDHTEVCGSSFARTIFCHRVVGHLLNSDQDASVLYIDTLSKFRPEILVDDFGCSAEQLKRIQVLRTCRFPRVLRLFDGLQKGRLMRSRTQAELSTSSVETSAYPRLIVVDSISEIANPLLLCTEDLVCVLGLLNHVGVTLRSVAAHHRVAVVTTNDFSNGDAALGKMWLGSPHVRLLIKEDVPQSASAMQAVEVLRSIRRIR